MVRLMILSYRSPATYSEVFGIGCMW